MILTVNNILFYFGSLAVLKSSIEEKSNPIEKKKPSMKNRKVIVIINDTLWGFTFDAMISMLKGSFKGLNIL